MVLATRAGDVAACRPATVLRFFTNAVRLALRRRIGRWSRGLERIFEDVIQEGIAKREFRSDLDARLATLAILGMCNAASNWHRKESTDIDRTSAEFAQLVIEGMGKRPAAPRRRR